MICSDVVGSRQAAYVGRQYPSAALITFLVSDKQVNGFGRAVVGSINSGDPSALCRILPIVLSAW
jgi:hypothetical protein